MSKTRGTATDIKGEYLELLKRSLIDVLGPHSYVARPLPPVHKGAERETEVVPGELEERLIGREWPDNGVTMIGLTGLNNLQECMEDTLENDVPGDFIETGVWRGGATIFMRALLRLHGVTDRDVWVADSFEGLPPPDPDYPADARMRLDLHPYLAVSLDEVKRAFERYGMLDEQVRFLKGWFKDTLPTLRDHKWAVIRLDGDRYESTMVALESLYPGLSPGGYAIIDDYAVPGCREAVHDYRDRHGVDEEIRTVDWSRTYWRKGQEVAAPAGAQSADQEIRPKD